MESFNFAAGLRVIRAGMFVDDVVGGEFLFECAAAVAVSGVEDCSVVGEHRGGKPKCVTGVAECGDDVGGFDGAEGTGGDDHSGVVIDDVKDFDVCAVGQGPVGGVGLPAFVG